MQILNTNKLFYGKWPYKIVCGVKGAWAFRYSPDCRRHTKNHWADDSQLSRFAQDFVNLNIENQNIKIRVEGSCFNIFCRDDEILSVIKNHLKKWITTVYEPANNIEKQYLIDNGNRKILRNSLPLNKYRYKLYLNPHTDYDIRLKFWDWLSRYEDDRMYISRDSKHWLLNHIGWIPAPFLYVKEKQDLSMVCLYLGNNLKKVEEFVLRDNINNTLGQ